MPENGSDVAGRTAAALLIGVAGFQMALASGAPWGAVSYGGATAGTLPDHLRTASAVAAPLYLGLAAVAGGAGSRRARSLVLRVGAAWMAVGTVVNLASPSLPERLIWVPATAAAAVALWRAAPARARTTAAAATPGQ